MHRDQGCCGPGSVRDEGDEEGGKYVKESKWRDVIATLLPLVKKGRAGGRENENRREVRGKRRNVPGGLVAKILSSRRRGPRFHLLSGD